jgi:hypothetical protein
VVAQAPFPAGPIEPCTRFSRTRLSDVLHWAAEVVLGSVEFEVTVPREGPAIW